MRYLSKGLKGLLLGTVLALSAGAAQAAPLNFQINFNPTEAFLGISGPPGPPVDPSLLFVSPARFSVDSSILETDGLHLALISNFYAALGLTVWDQNDETSFGGFLGACLVNSLFATLCTEELFEQDPALYGSGFGFVVVDGEIAEMYGWVVGGPFPWIIFDHFTGSTVSGPITFNAAFDFWEIERPEDGFCCIPVVGTMLGTFSLSQVPEPGALSLFVIGLAGLAFTRRRKQ